MDPVYKQVVEEFLLTVLQPRRATILTSPTAPIISLQEGNFVGNNLVASSTPLAIVQLKQDDIPNLFHIPCKTWKHLQ